MKLTKNERMELQRQASARNGRADSARHARLILLLADGLTWAQIRAKLDCADSYINRWSTRFQSDRLAGLFARYAGRERYKVADASGVARNLVRQAKRIAGSQGTEMTRAGAIRRVIPWDLVQSALLDNGYARFVD